MTESDHPPSISSGKQKARESRTLLFYRVVLLALGSICILGFFGAPLIFTILIRPATSLNFIGLAVTIFAAITLTRTAGNKYRILALAMLLVGLVFAFEGRRLYERAHFFVAQSTYVHALPGLLAGDDGACPTTWCAVDLGPPPVVFFMIGGFAGGQWGVCYDPKEVTSVPHSERAGEEWDRSNVYLIREKTMSYAELRNHWYLCSSG